MIYEMYTLWHKKSMLHDGIFLFRSNEHAMYELEQRVKPEQREVYRVCNIGAFDVETGSVTVNHEPFFIDFPPVDRPTGAEIASVPQQQLNSSVAPADVQVNEFANKTQDLDRRNPGPVQFRQR